MLKVDAHNLLIISFTINMFTVKYQKNKKEHYYKSSNIPSFVRNLKVQSFSIFGTFYYHSGLD